MTTGGHRLLASPGIQPFFRVDSQANIIPVLATGYKENPDDPSIVINLRKGVKFQDGTDFNATAAKWNLDLAVTAKMPGTVNYKSIDVVDDYTIRINLAKWDNTAVPNLPYTTEMISPTAYQQNGGQQWATTHPVGTGPFQLVSFVADGKTVWKKWAGYWESGKPYLDEIDWTPIVDGTTRLAALKSGEIDFLNWGDAKDVADLQKAGFKVMQEKGATSFGLIPDSANSSSPWANLKVRQAAQYAIDSQTLIDTILKGQAEAPNQIVGKANWAYNSKVVGYPFNPAKARQLLTEAGYPNGFSTTLTYNQDATFTQIYGAVQGYLNDVGIKAAINMIQIAAYLPYYSGASWTGLLHGGSAITADAANFMNTQVSGNSVYYSQMLKPDDYSQAIANAITAKDFQSKQKYVQEAISLMVDKYCLWQYTYIPWNIYVSTTKVHDTSLGTLNTWWTPENAWVEK
jgi:peptide/nickel transport system substrate-binding protein